MRGYTTKEYNFVYLIETKDDGVVGGIKTVSACALLNVIVRTCKLFYSVCNEEEGKVVKNITERIEKIKEEICH